MTYLPTKNAIALATLALLSACGGGGGSDAPAPVAAAPAPVVADTSGQMINSYVSGATVTLDLNDDGICADNEPKATTSANGGYRFSAMGSHLVCATGGTNTVTGLPFVGKLTAPAGATVVTPLTTLVVAQVMSTLPAPTAGRAAPLDPAAVAAAQSKIMAQLNLAASAPVLTTDPVALMTRAGAAAADARLEQSNAAVQVLLQQVAASIVASANLPATANATATNEAFNAAVSGLQTALSAVGAAPVDLTTASTASTSQLINATAVKAAATAKANTVLQRISPSFATLSQTNVAAAIAASPVADLVRSVGGASVASLTTKGGAETVALSTTQVADVMRQLAPLLTENADAGAASVAALTSLINTILPASGAPVSQSAAETAITNAVNTINGALPPGRTPYTKPTIQVPAPVVIPPRS
ncbi:MAG: hypothetical protein V7631_745 [Massilia sp.]|jgi:hypothetical protein